MKSVHVHGISEGGSTKETVGEYVCERNVFRVQPVIVIHYHGS